MFISGNPGSCGRGCSLQKGCVLLLPRVGSLLIWDHFNLFQGTGPVHVSSVWFLHTGVGAGLRVTPLLCCLMLMALVSASGFFWLGTPGGFRYLLWGHHTLDDQLCSGYLVSVRSWGGATAVLFEVQEAGGRIPCQPHTHTHLPWINLFSILEPEWQFKTQTSFVSLPCLKPFAAFKIPLTSMSLFFSLVPHEEKWSGTYAYEGDTYAWHYKNNT